MKLLQEETGTLPDEMKAPSSLRFTLTGQQGQVTKTQMTVDAGKDVEEEEPLSSAGM